MESTNRWTTCSSVCATCHVRCKCHISFENLYWRCGCFIQQKAETGHWAVLWGTLQMPVWSELLFWYFYKNLFLVAGLVLIRAFPFPLCFRGVNTWLLSAVLMAVSRDLYFTVACQQDPKLTGVQQWLTFLQSRHPVGPKLRLSRQPLTSRPPAETSQHSPQLQNLTGRLGNVLPLLQSFLLMFSILELNTLHTLVIVLFFYLNFHFIQAQRDFKILSRNFTDVLCNLKHAHTAKFENNDCTDASHTT